MILLLAFVLLWRVPLNYYYFTHLVLFLLLGWRNTVASSGRYCQVGQIRALLTIYYSFSVKSGSFHVINCQIMNYFKCKVNFFTSHFNNIIVYITIWMNMAYFSVKVNMEDLLFHIRKTYFWKSQWHKKSKLWYKKSFIRWKAEIKHHNYDIVQNITL